MIKGRIKSLNELETAVSHLIGDPSEKYGVSHYFESLKDSFSEVVDLLERRSRIFTKQLSLERPEDRQSIANAYEDRLNPLLQTFYEAYFVTMHSVLESAWMEVIEAFGRPVSFYKISSKYRDKYNKSSTKTFIDRALIEHEILLTYNDIRNDIVHAKPGSDVRILEEVEQGIQSGRLVGLQLAIYGGTKRFSVTGLEFGNQYAGEVVSLLKNIISKSQAERQN